MILDQPSEQELQNCVHRAQNGDTSAFEQLYKAFFAQVYRYTVFRLPQDVAEDTVADIFVKVWEKLHTYSFKKNIPFSAWLLKFHQNHPKKVLLRLMQHLMLLLIQIFQHHQFH